MSNDAAIRQSPRCRLGALAHLSLAVLFLSAGACVDLEQVVRVGADGGGELLFNVRFDPKILEEAIESGEAASIEEMLVDMRKNAVADAQSQASALGEGVRYVDVEELAGDKPGLRLRFEFDDVTALRLSPFGPLASDAPGAGSAEPIVFGFERGRRSSVLTTALFSAEELAELEQELKESSASPPATAEKGPLDQMAGAMMDMMKRLFEGLQVALVIEPLGEIRSTNSSYRDGDRVTLLRFDFGSLLADEEKLAMLAEQQGEPSLAALRQLVGEVDGMQMELEPEMRVEFRER